MKTGDVVTKSDLIQAGFHQVDWFAGYMVFKRYEEELYGYTYLFYDYFEGKIVTTVISKQ